MALLALVFVACSGQTSARTVPADSGPTHTGSTGSMIGQSGSTAGSSGDASMPLGPPNFGSASPCPVLVPDAGAACPTVGLECEYGSNADLGCNQFVSCQATGDAGPPMADGGRSGGPTEDGGSEWVYPGTFCPVRVMSCPTAYDQIRDGDYCAPPDAGTSEWVGPGSSAWDPYTCAYPQGTCVCWKGYPPGPFWTCYPAAPGCPSPRPRIGASCTDENRVCDFGACNGGIQLKCAGGIWQIGNIACGG